MGKASRLKRLRKERSNGIEEQMSSSMTENFQNEIRNSAIWDQMVAQFGEKEAERLLKGCKAEVKSGPDF